MRTSGRNLLTKVFLLLFFHQICLAQASWVLAVKTGNRALDEAIYKEANKAFSPFFCIWDGVGSGPDQLIEIIIGKPETPSPTSSMFESQEGWYCEAYLLRASLPEETNLTTLLHQKKLKLELLLWRPNQRLPEVYCLNLSQVILSGKETQDLLNQLAPYWMKRLVALYIKCNLVGEAVKP